MLYIIIISISVLYLTFLEYLRIRYNEFNMTYILIDLITILSILCLIKDILINNINIVTLSVSQATIFTSLRALKLPNDISKFIVKKTIYMFSFLNCLSFISAFISIVSTICYLMNYDIITDSIITIFIIILMTILIELTSLILSLCLKSQYDNLRFIHHMKNTYI